MQRAAHSPGLDERAITPKRILYISRCKAVHSRPQGQFGGGHQLCLNAADARDDFAHVLAIRPLQQIVLYQTPGIDLTPIQRTHSSIILRSAAHLLPCFVIVLPYALLPLLQRSVDLDRRGHEYRCSGDRLIQDERPAAAAQTLENLEHRRFLTSTPEKMEIKYPIPIHGSQHMGINSGVEFPKDDIPQLLIEPFELDRNVTEHR